MGRNRTIETKGEEARAPSVDKNAYANVEDALINVSGRLGKEGGAFVKVVVQFTQGGEVVYRGYPEGDASYVGGVFRP